MKMLPVSPVETLATIRTAAPTPAPAPSHNPGIVPPWLQGGGNDGIVPPWLQSTPAPVRTATPGRNPGIVPPWLQGPVGPDAPVGDDVPRILAASQPTGFDSTPVDVDAQAFPRAFRA